jgi:DNA polymerase-3 subunit gamma/tau
VLSRLQRFDLKRISITEITRRLETVLASEKIPATEESLAMIARAADGSMRDALSLTDQVISIGEGGITADRVREALGLVPEDEYLAIVDIIAQRKGGDVFETVRKLADGGVDFAVFLSGLGDMLRAQLAVVLGGKTAGVSPHALEALQSHRDEFAAGDLLRMLSMLSSIEPQFRRSGQQQLLVEMLLVRFALLDRSVSIEEVLQTLGGGGGAVPRTTGTSQRPAQVESRIESPRRTSSPPATSHHDVPADPVVSSPAPPLRVTPPGGQSAMPDWKAEFDQTANSGSRERLTTEAVREERLKMLRAQDPVLDAAVRELDLDLLD